MPFRKALVILSVGVALSLSGCAVASEPAPQASSASPTASPTPSASAAEAYADRACTMAAAIKSFNVVWVDNASTLESINAAAETAADSTRASLEFMVEENLPGADPADVALVQEDLTLRTADFETVAQSTSRDFSTFVFSYADNATDAYTRISQAVGADEVGCGQ